MPLGAKVGLVCTLFPYIDGKKDTVSPANFTPAMFHSPKSIQIGSLPVFVGMTHSTPVHKVPKLVNRVPRLIEKPGRYDIPPTG